MSDTKKKLKPKKKKKEVDDEDIESESSDEELDLTKECHPLSYYMNDRPEMIKQMFSIIKGSKLRAMLPHILKNYDIEELKLKCLDQLMGMSQKRVTCLLEGEILDSSSESEVLSSSGSSSDSSDSSVENGKASSHSNSKKSKRKSDTESIGRANKISKLEDETPPPEKGKTLLEILELEMRARAIRALLKKSSDREQTSPDKSNQNGDIVDLTVDEEEFPTVIKTEPPSTEQEKSFENKVVQSKTVDKSSEEKQKKMLAELELRNKLKKKKTYRTREQRMENLEEVRREPVVRKEPEEEVRIKEEPKEIVIEDPEEGEVSSENEETPLVVKKEKEMTPEPVEEPKKVIDGERISAIDDGQFVPNENLEWEDDHIQIDEVLKDSPTVIELDDDGPELSGEENEKKEVAPDNKPEDENENKEVAPDNKPENDENKDTAVETNETEAEEHDISWRQRWLRNEDVQKVVKSSRICGLVKKRIAMKKSALATAAEIEKTDSNSSVPEMESVPVAVEGSVSEYKQLVNRTSGEECITQNSSEVIEGEPIVINREITDDASIAEKP